MSLRDDLNYSLAAFGLQIPERVDLNALAAKLPEKPASNTIALVTTAAALFYLAERGRNPKVRDIYDALIYCTTNISVGYCDIFAQTPLGKIIGSTLMTVGPAMAAKTLDGPRARADENATQQQILCTLQQILARMSDQKAAEAQTNTDERG